MCVDPDVVPVILHKPKIHRCPAPVVAGQGKVALHLKQRHGMALHIRRRMHPPEHLSCCVEHKYVESFILFLLRRPVQAAVDQGWRVEGRCEVPCQPLVDGCRRGRGTPDAPCLLAAHRDNVVGPFGTLSSVVQHPVLAGRDVRVEPHDLFGGEATGGGTTPSGGVAEVAPVVGVEEEEEAVAGAVDVEGVGEVLVRPLGELDDNPAPVGTQVEGLGAEVDDVRLILLFNICYTLDVT